MSIIIPVFMVEKYLPRCLDSVLQQTYSDWECILIDDGSPDRSGFICDEYAKKNKNFIVIHKENGGVSSARNKGLDVANGDWTMFVDADDGIANNTLNRCLQIVETNKLDLLQYSFTRTGNYGGHDGVSTVPLNPKDYIQERKFIVCAWGNLFRSSIIQNHHLRFDETLKYGEDQIFVFNYLHYASLCQRIDDQLYFYFFNEKSAINSYHKSKDLIKSIFAMVAMKTEYPEFIAPIDKAICGFLIELILNKDLSFSDLYAIYRQANLKNSSLMKGSSKLFYVLSKYNIIIGLLFIRVKFIFR